ncbi:RAD50-interacting protein 1 [Lethenteron reissneri]|uniref:RAD50-interacting protein 1 n=1 Tax=Lethenteron reissneri TaxID=7753 RepID=UPI002AB5F544|nr:RAD50-interacting protein 1 [Lethenteron reissneri]
MAEMQAAASAVVVVETGRDQVTTEQQTRDLDLVSVSGLTMPAHVAAFVDSEFGADTKKLKRLGEILGGLGSQRARLMEQVATARSEVPRRLERALHEAEAAVGELEALRERRERLAHEVERHVEETAPCAEPIARLIGQVDELEGYLSYLKWISQIEELSDSIQQHLMTNSIGEALEKLVSMSELDRVLQPSSCTHLRRFVRSTLVFWHKILREKLTNDFEEVLKQLQWPFISTHQGLVTPLTPGANTQELHANLETFFCHLLQLHIPDEVISRPRRLPEEYALPEIPPIALPFQLMLTPLEKRFRYHFQGNKQTNDLSKPEWYLTQVLTWISHHSDFLETTIQDVLFKANSPLDAKLEFIRGLMLLVMEKAAYDVPRLLFDDTLFCHLVDELLLFEREVRAAHGYPAALPGVLHVLSQEACFQKWLAVERKFSLEKVDSMLSSEAAWSCQYQDVGELEEAHVPDCAEMFMTLLQVITDRYKWLPQMWHKLKFLELQMDLLDDFRIRLTQVMKEEAHSPLGTRYCAVLNAAAYVTSVLSDWSDNVFFLQMQQAYLEEVSRETGDRATARGRMSELQLGQLASLEASVFDDTVRLLHRLQQEMLSKVGDCMFKEVKEKAQLYKRERWLSLPAQVEQVTMSLSSTACPFVVALRDRLLQMERQLSAELFATLWVAVAEKLDIFLYEEVILANHFNEGGAAQLQFDMMRNLFPLFAQYCKRPENYFKHVKEACLVLTLGVGPALLLREVLNSWANEGGKEDDLSDGEQSQHTAFKSLNEMGIYKLSPRTVKILLGLRTNLPANA